MSVPSPEDKRAAARRLMAERARRASMYRRRIVAGTLAAFVMAWSVIAWTGSMGTTTTSSAATATPTTTSSDSSGTVTQSTTTEDDFPSAMTTQQS